MLTNSAEFEELPPLSEKLAAARKKILQGGKFVVSDRDDTLVGVTKGKVSDTLLFEEVMKYVIKNSRIVFGVATSGAVDARQDEGIRALIKAGHDYSIELYSTIAASRQAGLILIKDLDPRKLQIAMTFVNFLAEILSNRKKYSDQLQSLDSTFNLFLNDQLALISGKDGKSDSIVSDKFLHQIISIDENDKHVDIVCKYLSFYYKANKSNSLNSDEKEALKILSSNGAFRNLLRVLSNFPDLLEGGFPDNFKDFSERMKNVHKEFLDRNYTIAIGNIKLQFTLEDIISNEKLSSFVLGGDRKQFVMLEYLDQLQLRIADEELGDLAKYVNFPKQYEKISTRQILYMDDKAINLDPFRTIGIQAIWANGAEEGGQEKSIEEATYLYEFIEAVDVDYHKAVEPIINENKRVLGLLLEKLEMLERYNGKEDLKYKGLLAVVEDIQNNKHAYFLLGKKIDIPSIAKQVVQEDQKLSVAFEEISRSRIMKAFDKNSEYKNLLNSIDQPENHAIKQDLLFDKYIGSLFIDKSNITKEDFMLLESDFKKVINTFTEKRVFDKFIREYDDPSNCQRRLVLERAFKAELLKFGKEYEVDLEAYLRVMTNEILNPFQLISVEKITGETLNALKSEDSEKTIQTCINDHVFDKLSEKYSESSEEKKQELERTLRAELVELGRKFNPNIDLSAHQRSIAASIVEKIDSSQKGTRIPPIKLSGDPKGKEPESDSEKDFTGPIIGSP